MMPIELALAASQETLQARAVPQGGKLRTMQLREHLAQVPSQPLVGGDKHGEAVLGHASERLGRVNLPLVQDVVD